MPRAAQAFAAVRFVFSIQAAKSNASLRSTRRIENCDAIHPDKYMASRREAYRAIARPSARLDASANSPPVLRSLIKNVLVSARGDHGPRDTSLTFANRDPSILAGGNAGALVRLLEPRNDMGRFRPVTIGCFVIVWEGAVKRILSRRKFHWNVIAPVRGIRIVKTAVIPGPIFVPRT